MTDRRLSFKPEMIAALLDGRKTQTRRLLRPLPEGHVWRYGWSQDEGAFWQTDTQKERIPMWVGDRVVVNEGWRVSKIFDDRKPDELIPRLGSIMYDGGGSMGGTTEYPKTGPRLAADFKLDRSWPAPGVFPDWAGRRRASFHMPRWASRLTLLIDDVRVERLQDISEADALAEGVKTGPAFGVPGPTWTARDAYQVLWERINGPGSWEANPWVVAYTFRVEPRNIDALEAA